MESPLYSNVSRFRSEPGGNRKIETKILRLDFVVGEGVPLGLPEAGKGK
jgi:hypothetical protein